MNDSGPHTLRDYALLADGERGAVVSPSGEVAWMCFPGWDDDPVFASLLGGRNRYTVRPCDPFVWGGQYDEGTLVWRNRWVLVGGGITECLEALSFPGHATRAVLVRRVIARHGPAHLDVRLEVGDDFRAERRPSFRRTAEGVWEARRRDTWFRWQVPADVRHEHGLRGELRLDAGQQADLVLELSDHPFDGPPVTADPALTATAEAWRRAVPEVVDTAAPRDARHAVAVLRGLTTGTGALVAAATTSLPERANEGRDYDYRFAWIRDQCYSGLAGAAAARDVPNAVELLDSAVHFIHQRVIEDGPDLRPAYRTNGDRVPSGRTIDLPGYPGAPDVATGNKAGEQFQLDTFGEALQLFAAAARLGRIDPDVWRAAEIAADAIRCRWHEPDAGVWELEPRRYAHSRLACAAGLRQIAAEAPPGGPSNDWLQLAERITAETTAQSLHPSGRWQRADDDERCDAALLLAGLRGAVPADDPRTASTLRAVQDELVVDEYVYRCRVGDEPLGRAEGAFLLCGFWLSLAAHQAGDRIRAVRLFERNRAACGPAGILSEEYDVHQRQLRGNFPQAFVHAQLLETAATITSEETSS